MEKKYFIELDKHQGIVAPYAKESIIEAAWQDDLNRIPAEIVKKYDLKAGTKKQELEEKYEEGSDEYEEIFDSSRGVKVLCPDTDYIDFDDLKDDELYWDKHSDELYTADIIKGWDTVKHIQHWDGYNWVMLEVKGELEIECEKLGEEKYSTGIKVLYRLKNGKEFTVDCSAYSGSIDHIKDMTAISELEDLAK
jgi:hypothetical protein